MYDFIFIVYYRLFSLIRDADPKDSAINFITIVFFTHLFLIANIFTFFSDINLLAFGKGQNKFFWLPFVIAFMILVYRLYKKRGDRIIAKYSNRENVLSWVHVVVVFTLTLGPLLLGIYFLNYN